MREFGRIWKYLHKLSPTVPIHINFQILPNSFFHVCITRICIWLYVYVYDYICICICIIYIYITIMYIYMYMYTYMYTYMYIMYMYIYVRICTCIHICTYIYIINNTYYTFKKKLLDADDITTWKHAKITKFCKINRTSLFTATLCLHGIVNV